MSVRVLAIVACLLVAGTQAQSSSYSWVSCSANRTDAFCNAQATSVTASGAQCCAQVNQTLRNVSSAVGTFCVASELARSASSYVVNSNLTYTWACIQNLSTVPTQCSKNSECSTSGSCCASRAVSMSNGTAASLYNACTANTTLAYSAVISATAGNTVYARACLPADNTDNGNGNNNNSTGSNAMIIKYSLAMISALFALTFF